MLGILTMLLFFKQRCLLSSLTPPPSPFSLLFSSLHFWLLFFLPAVCYLLLGLVDPWPSYPWAIRHLTLAWSLTSSSRPHPQVRCEFSLQKGLVATAVQLLDPWCVLCMLSVFACCMTIKTNAVFFYSSVNFLGVILLVWNNHLLSRKCLDTIWTVFWSPDLNFTAVFGIRPFETLLLNIDIISADLVWYRYNRAYMVQNPGSFCVCHQAITCLHSDFARWAIIISKTKDPILLCNPIVVDSFQPSLLDSLRECMGTPVKGRFCAGKCVHALDRNPKGCV